MRTSLTLLQTATGELGELVVGFRYISFVKALMCFFLFGWKFSSEKSVHFRKTNGLEPKERWFLTRNLLFQKGL